MKTSVKILKSFGEISIEDKDIANTITEHIGVVTSSYDLTDIYNGIVVAEITKKEDHPNSDKLGIYQIRYSEKENTQVVAGDRSLNIGDKVAYLKPGSKVPYTFFTQDEPFVISTIKLRGVESNGMLGSERELNIGNSHENVFVLPKDAPVGEPFGIYYELNDIVFELENKAITNRGDLFGALGLARELTALSGKRFVEPDWYSKPKEVKSSNSRLGLKVLNDVEANCPRYCAITMQDIVVEESPVWLKAILLKCGMKPINNVVDITNYISLILGQPLHAFDYDKLRTLNEESEEVNINIRMGRAGESILCLDDKVHEIDDSVIVIADNNHPIAIAGIIGGKETEIDFNTKNIILESANFNKNSIRRSCMKLGLFTDAATRFKHSLDITNCKIGILKAVELLKEISKGTVSSNLIDIYGYEEKPRSVSINIERMNSHIGISLDTESVRNILEYLGYTIVGIDENNIIVRVPSWRRDVEIPEDIHEDIARIYGLNNVLIELPKKVIKPTSENPLFEIKKRIRNILENLGGNEVLTYNFVGSNLLKSCNISEDIVFKIKNPLAPELSLMRPSILPSLLQKSKENLQRGFSTFLLYEMNISHLKDVIDNEGVPFESWYLSGSLIDKRRDDAVFYGLKEYLQRIFTKEHVNGINYVLIKDIAENGLPQDIKLKLECFEPNSSAIVLWENLYLGIIGEYRQDIKNRFKLPMYSGGFEININTLLDCSKVFAKNKPSSIYPSSTIDLCYEVEKSVRYFDIYSEINRVVNTEELNSKIECLDIYASKDMGKKKRITFRILLSNYNKTLTDKDIKAITERITSKIIRDYQGQLV